MLEGQNAYGIATGDEVKPTTTTGGSNTTIQDWEKREMKAKVLLKLSVKDCIIPHIRDCKTTNDIWTILKEMSEIKNTNQTLYLKKKILSIKMEENDSVYSFISWIKEVKDKLTNIGQTVANDDLAIITMNGMMYDYHMFITRLNAREKPPGFEELTGIFLQEEERRLSLKPQNSDLALMTRFKPKGKVVVDHRRGNASRKRTPQGMTLHKHDFAPKFFYCGKIGHIAKFFHKKKVDGERYKQRRHAGHLVDADADQNQGAKSFMAKAETTLTTEEDESDIWFVDSGASSHMTGKKKCFKNFRESNTGVKVYLGDNRGYEIKGHGDFRVPLPDGKIRNISDVWYVPGIKKNLISASKITDQDLKVEFFKSHCIIKDLLDQMKLIAIGIHIGGLYKLDVKSTPQQALMSSDNSAGNFWHQRLGHINFSDLLLLQNKGMVDGLPVLKKFHIDCEACAFGKQHRDEFPIIKDRKRRDILELLHTDLCGPTQTRSLGGAYYFLIFVNVVQDSHRYIFLNRRVMLLSISSNSET